MKPIWISRPFEDCLDPVSQSKKVQRKGFLDNGAFPVVSQEQEFINGYWNQETDVFKPARPVVVFGDHTKVVKYVDFDFVLGADGVKILQPKDFLVAKFLYYWLQSITLPALGYARHFRLLKELTVSHPPTSEQRRIVGILNEALEGIATAKANAEKNLQNARAAFASHLDLIFSRRGAGWVVSTLDKLSINLDSRRVPITKNVRSGGAYPYYGASGIVDYVENFIFEGDTLLVSEDGANLLARSSPIAFSVSGKYWVNNHAHILKFKDFATQRFVEFYLGHIKLDEFITGAAQPKLNQKSLNSIPIPIPLSVEAQAEIVERAESLQRETNCLRDVFSQKLEHLAALKQSLLHDAFAGKL